MKISEYKAHDTCTRYGSLIDAIRLRDEEKVHSALQKGCSVQIATSNGTCPLEEARRMKLNRPLLQELEEKDQGFADELFRRKELAHHFGIKGFSTLGEHTFDLECMYRHQALRMNSAAARAFYPMLAKEIRNKGKLWERFQDLSTFSEPELSTALASVLDRIPILAAQALDHIYQSKEQIKHRLMQEKIVALYHGWPGHLAAAVIDTTHISRCNRGDRPETVPCGIVTQKITHPQYIVDAIQGLRAWTEESFYTRLDQLLEPLAPELTPCHEQDIGNCSLVAGELLEHALLLHLFPSCVKDRQVKEVFCKAIIHLRRDYSRHALLKEYLTWHQTNTKWPLDKQLIDLIQANPKSS